MPTRRPKDPAAFLPVKHSIYRVLLAMPDRESPIGRMKGLPQDITTPIRR